jgi:hypothetical protein
MMPTELDDRELEQIWALSQSTADRRASFSALNPAAGRWECIREVPCTSGLSFLR